MFKAILSENIHKIVAFSSMSLMVLAFLATSRSRRRKNGRDEKSEHRSSQSGRLRQSAVNPHEKRALNENAVRARPRTFLSDNEKDDESINSDIYNSRIDLPKLSKNKHSSNRVGKPKDVIYYSDNEQSSKMKSQLARKLASENNKMDDLYFAVFKKLES